MSRPELLAPAGSLDAVRAAVANGADAVYLGVVKFNARDEGAHLSFGELEQACRIAHERGVRVYLTLNVLLKPLELEDALRHLGECLDRGIDAVLVQDLGFVRLIQCVYPGVSIHGSTQMTVHDTSGAVVMRDLGVDRVVLARENTIDDIRAIRSAVPSLVLETFVHGALCIAYSGQCYMSGMISERSANRGACAQSCRKDYTLADVASGAELDRGYLISAKDLGAFDRLGQIAEAGVGCFKIEGRKKKPEYVATVTKGYREFLDSVERGTWSAPTFEEVRPLVQIFSRGFTGGMYGGRAGRDYVTRTQPDNHGVELGLVVGTEAGELLIEVTRPVQVGDGLGFEPPGLARPEESRGFSVAAVRTISERGATIRQAIPARERIPAGWRVFRSSEAALLDRARRSYAALQGPVRGRRVALEVRLFGQAGAGLKAIFRADDEEVTLSSGVPLAPAAKRSLDEAQLRDHLGRLGGTPFVLGTVDAQALGRGLFLPVSELNHLRQLAIDELLKRRDWARAALDSQRFARIHDAVSAVPMSSGPRPASDAPESPQVQASSGQAFRLSAEVWRAEDAHRAAEGGVTEVVFDPFLRHPAPSRARVRALGEELERHGIAFRLRTPTIVRPEDRHELDPWVALGLPLLSGHVGLIAEWSRSGCDVVADYAVNCFNGHTAAELFRLGASRITASVELTTDEILAVAAPWRGVGFDVVVYGRPEGMTLEHCVLSAAFDRIPHTCRDLCVRLHPDVALTDPAGYVFPVATDSACRNRLLHSRPLEGSAFVPRLWRAGVRGYRLVFNVAAEPVREMAAGYRALLDTLGAGGDPDTRAIRALVGGRFTRGHFARAV